MQALALPPVKKIGGILIAPGWKRFEFIDGSAGFFAAN